MKDNLFDEALDAAVTRHVGTLFEVMMVEKDTEVAMQRFRNGLARMVEREIAVREVIRKL